MINVIYVSPIFIGGKWKNKIWAFENGVLIEQNRSDGLSFYGDCEDTIFDIMRSRGFNTQGTSDFGVVSVLDKCLGHDESFLYDVIDEMIKKQNERREKRLEKEKKWKELSHRFNGYVIGIEKKIDVFPTGFSVRVLLNTSLGYVERKEYMMKHKKEICQFAVNEIRESGWISKRIGDITFYKPVLITALRNACEIEIKFEVKDVEAFGSV